MRHIVTVIVCVAVGIGVTPTSTRDTGQQRAEEAAGILAQARAALGGDALAAVKTFTARGRTQRLQGNNLVPIEFEMACELPDKFVRTDEVPAQESGPTTRGFNGDGLIQLPPPPPRPAARAGAPPPRRMPPPGARGAAPAPGRAAGPPPFQPPASDPLSAIKQEFVRLTLGMFAASFDAYPLTFARIGEAQAPEGKAQVIEARGPDGSNVVLRLFVHAETHLPIMVTWPMPAANVVVTVPGQAKPTGLPAGTVVVEGPPVPPADATEDQVAAFKKLVADLRRQAQTTLVEHRLYYGEYRKVDGVQFPFRLRRAIGADTVEETNFDEFRINPRIDPRKFEVVR